MMSLSYSEPTYDAMLDKVQKSNARTPAAFCQIFQEVLPGLILDYRIVTHEDKEIFVMVADRNHRLAASYSLENGGAVSPEIQAMAEIVDGSLPGFGSINVQFAYRTIFNNDPEGHYERWASEGWP